MIGELIDVGVFHTGGDIRVATRIGSSAMSEGSTAGTGAVHAPGAPAEQELHLTPSGSPRPDEPAVEFVGVSKRFGEGAGAAFAIERLDLSVRSGELMVFVGPSGCGKTTSLRLVNRLIEPTGGVVKVAGRDVMTVPPARLRRDIGYVIQQAGLFPHRTIAQNIATVPSLLGWSRTDIDTRVEELADLVGLDRALLSRRPSALSGGQQQRVGVARALAARPSVLLMDEPYSAVDPVVRAHLQDELLALHERVGTTILLVTHDIDEAVRLGDRVAVFTTGRLAQVATPDDLLAHPADAYVEHFLGGDRQLRRLALRDARDLVLGPLSPSLDRQLAAGTVVEVPVEMTGRNIVDAMLESGRTIAVVVDGDRRLGTVTLTELTDLLHLR
ncbi:MAG: ABC transporter ATP-binding protein [Microthrixaceae bacterium]